MERSHRSGQRFPCLMLLTALAFLPLAGLHAVDVPETTRVFLTGMAGLGAGRLGRYQDTVSYRVIFSGDEFTMNALEGAPLSGRFTASGSRYDCFLDAESLDALVSAATSPLAGVVNSATVMSYRLVITLGTRREAFKLSGLFKLGLQTAHGSFKAAFVLRCDGGPRRVLVLDDSNDPDEGSAAQVISALRSARHVVFDGGFYRAWDGVSVPLDEVEVVLLLQGVQYDDSMNADADEALAAFVLAGGGLVRTEWGAYAAGDSPTLAIDELLPAVAPDSDYDYGSTWRTVVPRHPLLRNVPRAFSTPDAGYSVVVAQPGAEVVMEDQDGIPMVTAGHFGLGRVIHINHDLRYSVSVIPAPILAILINAAEYGAP